MSSEEMAMHADVAAYNALHSRRTSRAERRFTLKQFAVAMRGALYTLITLAGAGSFAFGFWLLAERQKNLGFIDVLVAFAVVAGTAIAAVGVTGLVRSIREGRKGGRQTA